MAGRWRMIWLYWMRWNRLINAARLVNRSIIGLWSLTQLRSKNVECKLLPSSDSQTQEEEEAKRLQIRTIESYAISLNFSQSYKKLPSNFRLVAMLARFLFAPKHFSYIWFALITLSETKRKEKKAYKMQQTMPNMEHSPKRKKEEKRS